jgi:hypothetical protein
MPRNTVEQDMAHMPKHVILDSKLDLLETVLYWQEYNKYYLQCLLLPKCTYCYYQCVSYNYCIRPYTYTSANTKHTCEITISFLFLYRNCSCNSAIYLCRVKTLLKKSDYHVHKFDVIRWMLPLLLSQRLITRMQWEQWYHRKWRKSTNW